MAVCAKCCTQLSGIGDGRERGTNRWRKKRLLLTKKQNKRKPPVGEKQTGWLAGKAGLGWTRLDRAGQGRAGQDRAGQDRAGQGRTGQDRAGQGWTGQDKAEQDTDDI